MDAMDAVEIYAEEEPESLFYTIYTWLSWINPVTIAANYGWYILIGVVVSIYVYNKFLADALAKKLAALKRRRDEAEYAAKYHKNPDLFAERLAAQQSYAEKLQAQYNLQAEEFKQKQEEKVAKKREEFLMNNPGPSGSGSKLGNASTSKSLKPEYNPLMGDNSRGYRPQRKSPCGSGGCGK